MEAQNTQRNTQQEQGTEMNNMTNVVNEQPAAQETMDPKKPWYKLNLRGGGEGEDVCCGICAGIACFECCECCC